MEHSSKVLFHEVVPFLTHQTFLCSPPGGRTLMPLPAYVTEVSEAVGLDGIGRTLELGVRVQWKTGNKTNTPK